MLATVSSNWLLGFGKNPECFAVFDLTKASFLEATVSKVVILGIPGLFSGNSGTGIHDMFSKYRETLGERFSIPDRNFVVETWSDSSSNLSGAPNIGRLKSAINSVTSEPSFLAVIGIATEVGQLLAFLASSIRRQTSWASSTWSTTLVPTEYCQLGNGFATTSKPRLAHTENRSEITHQFNPKKLLVRELGRGYNSVDLNYLGDA